MLRQLAISNYTLIERLDLDLETGLTVLTGETGAGKSVILDALGLVLGDRADARAIRSGARQAEIVAVFSVLENAKATDWLREHDLDNSEDCFLRRVITSEGRSRAWINGQPMPLQSLKTLGEALVDLHGQHEHQLLLNRSSHITLLDAFGGHLDRVEAVSEAWQVWHSTATELARSRSLNAERSEKRALLQYQLQEFDALAVLESEYDELGVELRQLANAEDIGATLDAVLALCGNEESSSIGDGINRGIAMLDRLPDCRQDLVNARELLDSARIHVQEAMAALSSLRDRIEVNPARLAEVEGRMADIHALARKHRIAPEAIVSHHAVLAKELDEIRGQEFRIDALEAALAQALVCFESEASMLSEARHASAKSLAAKVQAQLHTLGMENCHFNIDLTPSCGDPERNGRERVEFLISTLPGSPLGPLSRVASGGELSRISLAIQVVTAETTSIPTIVFDEVDVGIGAGVAAIVGRLMRRLGERGQVLCVTHLAQVAACGHHHILVSKEKTPLGLTACLQSLNTRARIEEIARMLGGRKLTKTSRQHAEELLDLEQNPAD